ncbi:hypothetical protein PHABIO_334 [Pseudomonas phage Phabio]|uniref:Uncharacterized protein n=1 Tax=Pseudomonas phage Phabio TaxID=2006668 RepID=A0A1Y0SWT5_9CAUD|nr:hypothetical protein MZD05_gp334 [Pseudomonas phage Phabio]ARV76965.1 hypothetical protein PHABIO_334 [Pseudomonas phage Phabio]
MTNNRITKKLKTLDDELWAFHYWMADLRGYLLEADHENIDLRIIFRQFKRRLKRERIKIATVTRMHYYVKVALGRD